MAPVNKVIYGSDVLIDLTEDTVTKTSLLKGITAHNKAGSKITGTIDFENVNVTQNDLAENITAMNSERKAITGVIPFSQVKNVTADKMVVGTSALNTERKIVNGTIDFSYDNALAENLLKGKIAHTQNGAVITGTAEVKVIGTTLVMPEGLMTVSYVEGQNG